MLLGIRPKVEVAASGSYSARCVRPRPAGSAGLHLEATPDGPLDLDLVAVNVDALLQPLLPSIHDGFLVEY